MLLSISIFLLLSIGLLQSSSIAKESCESHITPWSGSCAGTLSISRSCQSAIVDLAKTSFKSCDTLYLMWSYPMNNLTLIIETPYTEHQQSYSIDLQNDPSYNIRKYLLINDQEIEIKSTEDTIVINSDSNYQIKVKFQAQPTISYYGFILNYNVTKA